MRGLVALAALLGVSCAMAQDFPVDATEPVPAVAPAKAPPSTTQAADKAPIATSPVARTPAAVISPTMDAVAVTPVPVLAEGAETTPLSLLGQSVKPGTRAELRWASGQSFDGTVVTTPVIVVHGSTVGPRICLTAAVHGDELNGIEIIRRLMNELDPVEMSGTVIGVPIVNFLGYARGSRYLPDRRDLNRYFPGSTTGSAASRIAHSFFNEVAVNCQALVDFHTGSFDRKNLPQVRGDLRIPAVLEFSRGFGATAVLHSPGARGMLRRAAVEAGIPAITFEVG